MRPDTLLSVYELRCPPGGLARLLGRSDPAAILGPGFLGCHLEAGFAFVFCDGDQDISGLLSAVPGLGLAQIHRLRYDEWQDGAHAGPIRVGPLLILPPGPGGPGGGAPATLPPGPRPAPLVIDPGLAFGYGGHPTTKACLSFLARLYAPQNPSPPRSCLDIGCGTGILALAAARLGADSALGVDHSGLAMAAAEANLGRNRLGGRVSFCHGEAGSFAGHGAELLMANVPMAVHLELLGKGAYAGRRFLILSGLLPSEADALGARILASLPLKALDSHRDERWSSWLLGMP